MKLEKRYVGSKVVLAAPMNLGEYNDYQGWPIPADEDPATPGYLVEYEDGGKPNHTLHKGYISWSPADVFERSYKEMAITHLSFGDALTALKLSFKLARSGWNGKGMYIYYVPAGRYAPSTTAGHEIAYLQEDKLIPYLPYIAIKTIDGSVVPWLPSQTDILATDWEIVK